MNQKDRPDPGKTLVAMRRGATYREAAASEEEKDERATLCQIVAKEEEEEKWLSVALFATQCVEGTGVSSDRHTNTHKKKKKKMKQPQRIVAADSSRSYNKDQLMISYHENNNKRKRGNLCNADTGLSLWSNISVLVGNFEKHLWVLLPLHPSVLHEDNIRFALMGQESKGVEDLPLMFNVNVAMACGTFSILIYIYIYILAPSSFSALSYFTAFGILSSLHVASKVVGDKQREVEFMMRARHHLEYLFDSSQMEVAEGLICMAYHSFCLV